MVDGILSDRTDERRQLFEEAAGIGRYKERRKAAQRRLEAAEADLARLQDVIVEVESKVRGLARQKRRAQRYRELRARRLALEVDGGARPSSSVRAELEKTRRASRSCRQGRAGRARRARRGGDGTRAPAARGGGWRRAPARRAAARLEEMTRRIAEREREMAVAGGAARPCRAALWRIARSARS